MTILLGIAVVVMEWRDEQRQEVVEEMQAKLEDVQRVQKVQGEALDKLQRQVSRLVEFLLPDRDAEGAPQEPQGGAPGPK